MEIQAILCFIVSSAAFVPTCSSRSQRCGCVCLSVVKGRKKTNEFLHKLRFNLQHRTYTCTYTLHTPCPGVGGGAEPELGYHHLPVGAAGRQGRWRSGCSWLTLELRPFRSLLLRCVLVDLLRSGLTVTATKQK